MTVCCLRPKVLDASNIQHQEQFGQFFFAVKEQTNFPTFGLVRQESSAITRLTKI